MPEFNSHHISLVFCGVLIRAAHAFLRDTSALDGILASHVACIVLMSSDLVGSQGSHHCYDSIIIASAPADPLVSISCFMGIVWHDR